MKAIPLATLVPNTYFDQPVFLDKGYMLLTPDSTITPELIKRLKKWKYTQVLTDGQPKDQPSYLSGVDKNSVGTQTIDEDIRENAQVAASSKFYLDLVAFASTLFARYNSDGVLNLADVTEWVKKTIQMVHNNRDFIMRFIEVNSDPERYLVFHAVNSTIISLAIGDFLKLPPHRLIELGNASLLHEIGMFKMPPDMRSSSSLLTEEDRKKLLAHTLLGYRILKGFSAPENVALAALEHHERFDGSGYPRNLIGIKISEYARIIAVACSYDAMVSRRPFRQGAIDGHASIKDLLQKNRRQYDDRVLKALIYTLSVYPVGTAVLLSNNSYGIVMKTDPDKPRFPIVKILFDPEGKRLVDPLLIQTTEIKGLSILRSLTPEEAKAVKELA